MYVYERMCQHEARGGIKYLRKAEQFIVPTNQHENFLVGTPGSR